MATCPKNLLPNASFELDLGDGIPSNWADTHNPLTIKVEATSQNPQVTARSEAVSDPIDGERAARVETEACGGGAVGHLTSPLVRVQPCTPHVISVFARSDDPSAKLQLGMWTRLVDFTQTPDSLSHPMPLSPDWKRYVFTCCTNELEDRAVVHFKVTSNSAGAAVWFDAAQLEQSAQATGFEPRYAIEAAIAGRCEHALTHLGGGPLELFLTTYNRAAGCVEPILLRISELATGREVYTQTITDPIPRGRDDRKLTLDFPLLGEFRARLCRGDGEQISPEDYLFTNCPVIEDTDQSIPYVRRSAVNSVSAERCIVPWTNRRNWYSDPQPTLMVTDDDAIHVQTSDGHTVMRTRDGGRTWDDLQVTMTVNAVLRDGTFLATDFNDDGWLHVHRSNDQGGTWEDVGRIVEATSAQIGVIEQLRDGSLIIPIGIALDAATPVEVVHAFRSTDNGVTWSDGAPICPGGEPQILELQSGKLLAFCRNNPHISIDDLQRPFRNEGPWLFWQRFRGWPGLASYSKRMTLAESDDGGLTWHRQRPVSFMLEEMHGGGVQLPDGRVVFIHTHRGPSYHGGERAKVSDDEGRTWRDEIYFLTSSPSYPGYSGNCVLPPHLADGELGMILSVVGERSEGNWGSEGAATSDGFKYMPRLQAIRWRPLD